MFAEGRSKINSGYVGAPPRQRRHLASERWPSRGPIPGGQLGEDFSHRSASLAALRLGALAFVDSWLAAWTPMPPRAFASGSVHRARRPLARPMKWGGILTLSRKDHKQQRFSKAIPGARQDSSAGREWEQSLRRAWQNSWN